MELRGNAEAGPSRVVNGQAPRKKKHPKAQPTALVRKGTIPRPYLATAPKPVSALSQSTIDHLSQPASSKLLLPSAFARSRTAPSAIPTTGTTQHGTASRPGSRTAQSGTDALGPAGQRRMYAAGLAAPPTILPGGKPNAPLEFQSGDGPRQPRRRSAPRVGIGTDPVSTGPRRRSETALRSTGTPNQSTTALVTPLEAIDESAPPVDVRGAGRGARRRTALLTAEDVRVLGLARSASMRRTNVWDDLPETDDPPPAFPFPLVRGARLPPSIEAVEAEEGGQQGGYGGTEAGMSGPGEGQAGRPRSPPPDYDVAVSTLMPGAGSSAQGVALPGTANPEVPGSVPILAVQPTSRSASPTSSAFVSAPSSPVLSSVTHVTSVADTASVLLGSNEREDRRAWLEDLEAGYTLSERVERETERRRASEGEATVELQKEQSEATRDTAERPTEEPRPEEEEEPLEPVTELDLDEASSPILNLAVTEDAILAVQQESTEVAPEVQVDDTSLPTPNLAGEATAELPKPPTILETPAPTAVVDLTTENPLVVESRPAPNSPPGAPVPLANGFSPMLSPPIAQFVSSPPLNSEAVQTKGGDLDPDAVLATPAPQRKLTRGKAIRRSSSDSMPPSLHRRRSSQMSLTQLVQEPQETRETGVPGEGARQSPLFASKAFNPMPSPSLNSPDNNVGGEVKISPAPIPIAIPVARIPDLQVVTRPQPVTEASGSKDETADGPPVLLPHREAAMRRRHLTLRRRAEPIPPVARRTFDPNALINLYDEETEDAFVTIRALPSLPEDLMELFEGHVDDTHIAPPVVHADLTVQEHEPVLAAPTIQEQTPGSAEGSVADSQTSKRSRAPPPPPSRAPSLAIRGGGAGVKRRMSILSTADRDILPNYRTTSRRHRPPPPPVPAVSEETSAVPGPALPPVAAKPISESGSIADERPPPPLPPSDGIARYALVDKPLPLRIPPPLPSRPPPTFARPSLTVRPRGPRPPPPPPRPRAWAKMASLAPQLSPPAPSSEISEPLPALTERSRSESNIHEQASIADTPFSPARSLSAVDVRSPAVSVHSGPGPSPLPLPDRQQSVEYTDIDVLLHRMEGSGREYEGFSQLTAFLGPGKPTAASPADLALLLPGPVEVDSRRVTAQGKTKLKMSLLGARVAKCPICLAQFKEGEKGVLMPDCGHAGHERCARRWLRENGECWVCRARLGGELDTRGGGEGERLEAAVI